MAVMMEGAAVAMAVRSAVWRMIIRKAYGVRTGPIIRVVVERRVRNGAAFYKVNMVVCHILRIRRGALPIYLGLLVGRCVELLGQTNISKRDNLSLNALSFHFPFEFREKGLPWSQVSESPCHGHRVNIPKYFWSRHAVACLDLGSTFRKPRRQIAHARHMDNLDRPKWLRCPFLRWRWPPCISAEYLYLTFFVIPRIPLRLDHSLLDIERRYPDHRWFTIGEGWGQECVDISDHAAYHAWSEAFFPLGYVLLAK